MERWFSERFNVPGRPLSDWPAQKILDYTTIMLVEAEVEAEQQRSATGSGVGASAPAGSAQTTEDAYQRLRAQAAPPPMPPGAQTPA